MHSLDPNVTPSGFQRGWCGPPEGSVGDSLLSFEWGKEASPIARPFDPPHFVEGGARATGASDPNFLAIFLFCSLFSRLRRFGPGSDGSQPALPPGWMRGGDQLLHLRAGGADAAGGAAGLPHHPHGAEAPAGDAGDGQGGAPRHGTGGGPALRGAALHKVQLIPPPQ